MAFSVDQLSCMSQYNMSLYVNLRQYIMQPEQLQIGLCKFFKCPPSVCHPVELQINRIKVCQAVINVSRHAFLLFAG